MGAPIRPRGLPVANIAFAAPNPTQPGAWPIADMGVDGSVGAAPCPRGPMAKPGRRIGGAHVPPPCDHIGGHMLRDPNFLRFVVVVAIAAVIVLICPTPSARLSTLADSRGERVHRDR
jgi:hypothetical protein